MRGRISFVNPATRTGLIFGTNQSRYSFRVDEWQGPARPPRNAEVEFNVNGFEAVAVRPFVLGEEPAEHEQIGTEIRAFRLREPQVEAENEVESEPRDTMNSAQADHVLNDAEAETAEDFNLEGLQQTLRQGPASAVRNPFLKSEAKSSQSLPPINKLLFSQDSGVVLSKRRPWVPYAVGAVAIVALAAIGLIATHL